MKTLLLCSVAIAAFSTTSHAEGLSFGADIAIGNWTNSDGGSGLESNGGINGTDDRFTGKIGLSAANDFGMFVGQIDLNYQNLAEAKPSVNNDDTTMEMLDVTLRGTRDFGALSAGLFLGYGTQNDNGDSDLNMYYTYIGIDAAAQVSFGEVFGQIGYLDSHDEYDEGTIEAPFLRLGASYNLGTDMVMTGAVSVAGGKKYDDPDISNRTLGLELGLEKALSDDLSIYGSYEYTRIFYKSGSDKFGDNFGTVWLGLRYNLGGDTKRGGKLPNVGQWIAYNANEIE